jgi:hypothetical protein
MERVKRMQYKKKQVQATRKKALSSKTKGFWENLTNYTRVLALPAFSIPT